MHRIYIASKRKIIVTINSEYPEAEIIDVTSKAEQPWVRFSPFYPHGNIPVPFSKDCYAFSVEGLWQGLKVFENQDIDIAKFNVQDMKGIKRSIRRFGKILGHRKGINGSTLLSYLAARREIFLPSYLFVLKQYLQKEIQILEKILADKDIVLLDYETNTDIENLKKPLSHASLIADFVREKS